MKILFICTHNRCRSILAEAVANHTAGPDIEAYSAGSNPVDQVHPMTLKHLQMAGISVEGLKSQSWDEYSELNPDVVITVCDKAAGESCPLWFGKTIRCHWGLKDPSALLGSSEDVAKAFENTIALLQERIAKLQVISQAPSSDWATLIHEQQLDGM